MRLMKPALIVTGFLFLLMGGIYPLAVAGASAVLFSYQASGSLVRIGGRVVGSLHVGQYFGDAPGYFWGRPTNERSAQTGTPTPYGGPIPLSPSSPDMLAHLRRRIRHLIQVTPGLHVHQIPASLVESSASGLDPDVSVRGALIQVPRVARATGLSPQYLTALVYLATKGPEWNLFGVRRVNVLTLNLLVYRATRGL